MSKGGRAVITDEDRARRAVELEAEEQRELAAREAARKNVDFVQLARGTIKEFRGLMRQHQAAADLLLLLAEHMDRENTLVASAEMLEQLTGYSRSTLHRSIRALIAGQWMQVTKVGTTNAYTINSAVFWTSYGDRKWSVFNAKVLATSTEQDVPPSNDVKLKRVPFLRRKNPPERLVMPNEDLDPPDQRDLDLN